MASQDLDAILSVLENPIRRRIIKRLSEEPSYPLQLAKDLGLTQQLVAKHLAVMEEAGVVKSSWKQSPQGPRQRIYYLNQSLSITMDLAPHLFGTRLQALPQPVEKELRADAAKLMKQFQDAEASSNRQARVRALSEVISEIDEKLRVLEVERADLLHVRNIAMEAASETVTRIEGEKDRKRVLLHILDEHDRDVDAIASSLNISEKLVRLILEELETWFE